MGGKGYCFRCKKYSEIINGVKSIVKKKRISVAILKGKCPKGHTVSTFISTKEGGKDVGK